MSESSVMLNGFRVELSATSFDAYVQEVMDAQEFRRLRERLKSSWFLYLRDGKAYGLPRTPKPMEKFGKLETLNCDEHLWVVRARIDDVLPAKFPKYDAFRNRPFTFLGRKDEIVELISSRMKNLPSLVSGFKIRPKFTLEPKLVELREGELFIGLFMEVGTRWEVCVPVTDLHKAGIDLHGLYVVRRNPLARTAELSRAYRGFCGHANQPFRGLRGTGERRRRRGLA